MGNEVGFHVLVANSRTGKGFTYSLDNSVEVVVVVVSIVSFFIFFVILDNLLMLII